MILWEICSSVKCNCCVYIYGNCYFYIHLWADCLENVVASTSHSPMGLHGLLQGQLLLRSQCDKCLCSVLWETVEFYKKRLCWVQSGQCLCLHFLNNIQLYNKMFAHPLLYFKGCERPSIRLTWDALTVLKLYEMTWRMVYLLVKICFLPAWTYSDIVETWNLYKYFEKQS
jgi:hypothetical protein